MNNATQPVPTVECKNCVLFLIRRCYARHWWFRLVREPLIVCMRILAWRNGIDAWTHAVHCAECRGCVRFMKAELEVKSPTFRAFNGLIGPSFRRLRDSMLKQGELPEAKRIAAEALAGTGRKKS
jgi:hypothetical protein